MPHEYLHVAKNSKALSEESTAPYQVATNRYGVLLTTALIGWAVSRVVKVPSSAVLNRYYAKRKIDIAVRFLLVRASR